MKLLRNIRFYVLCLSLAAALAAYAWVSSRVPSGSIRITRLTDLYALLALLYLFLTLLPSPLFEAFPMLPYKGQVVKARRAFGVSAFFFALCHASIAFFYQLGGFSGLAFLSGTYLLAISLSFTALLILCLLTLTSFDFMKRRLGKGWKWLHRLIYAAGILVFIHALLLGSHFSDPSSSPVALVSFLALAALLILEGMRIDKQLARHRPDLPSAGVVTLAMVCLIFFSPYYLWPNGTGGTGFNIHAQHIQIARQAQLGGLPSGLSLSASQLNSPAFAGFRGDPTRRFTVSFEHPDTVPANQETRISFRVYDANTGDPQSLYTKLYGQFMHMVIVDSQLDYFDHLHPDPTADPEGNQFAETVTLPHPGIYHLYVDYQPYNALEQQQAFTLKVGSSGFVPAAQPPDATLTKKAGGYTFRLEPSAPLRASEMSVGNQTIVLNLTKDGRPVTDLWPSLADGHQDFGHLSMVNEETYDFIHVHPNEPALPAPDTRSGPDISFLPLGLYGPIKPGVYRVFAQASPGNQPLVAVFTVKIE